MWRISSRETTSGGIFSAAQTSSVMRGMENEIERDVAQEGYNDVQRYLSSVLRHPTGYYQSQVTVHSEGGDVIVDGDDVVYGPWLEGVGSRNQSTRFKGYFTFRKISQLLEAKSSRIADRIADRHSRRL
jgi:hypothetical protein